MNRASQFTFAAAALLAFLPTALSAQAVERWSGSTTVHGHSIPVHLSLSSSTKDGAVKGSFLNGFQQNPSSSGELEGNHLVLNFDYFARKLEGDFHDGRFTGSYGGEHGEPSPIELHPDRIVAAPVSHDTEEKNKAIRGDWEIAVKSPKGESAWTLRVSPSVSGQIKAVILRIDGDTNGLYGGYDPGSDEYEVSHFSAAGPALYTFKSQPDGTLIVTNPLRDDQQWTARRPAEARKEGLAAPTKSTEQTSVADSKAPFHFSAVDLDGKPVASTDARFRDKVVIVAVGGSWCPNCHDEAPFLVELYNRYHSRGLEVVNINFEDEAQLKNPTRLRAFVAKYHIPYTVLLGGTQAQVNEKLPQGKNLNCWPTTFFLGRDGLVKEVHAGFAGPETGVSYVNLKTETDTLLGKLLAQRDVASR